MAAAEKGGWPHFMLKEIHEEPEALQKTFTAPRGCPAHDPAAGSLPHDGAAGPGPAQDEHCGLRDGVSRGHDWQISDGAPGAPAVEAEVASEFGYRNPILGAEDLCMAVSQSGETADTLAALREAANPARGSWR